MGTLLLDSLGRLRMDLSLPMPPSDNKLYENLSGRTIYRAGRPFALPGGRKLSKSGEAYKKAVQDAVGELAALSPYSFRRHIPYTFRAIVYFEATENKGWPDRAKDRYKKLDAQNRIKLVTDTVSEVVGVDDRHHFTTIVKKAEDAANPRVEITLREEEPRDGEAESLL